MLPLPILFAIWFAINFTYLKLEQQYIKMSLQVILYLGSLAYMEHFWQQVDKSQVDLRCFMSSERMEM